MEHRFKLKEYKSLADRTICPECNTKKSFSLYIDTETNEPIADHVGRCERVDKCGYHFTPSMYFKANGTTPVPSENKAPVTAAIKPTSFIDRKIFNATLMGYVQNNFFIYLTSLFGIERANGLAKSYLLGTSKHFRGGCVFWQVDENTNVRTGKIMGYNTITGKRVKEPFNQITWAHKALKLAEFELKQCLYGLHLIKGNTKPIAVVESEKTAMIASVYLPQFIWLATSGKTQFTKHKAESLKGRKVVLFPDLGGFAEWQKIAKQYNFSCSDLLEQKSSEADKLNGCDVADYLIKTQASTPVAPAVPLPPSVPTEPIHTPIKPIPPPQVLWDVPNFTDLAIPPTLRLDSGTMISNVDKCISSHLKTLESNNGNKAYYSYLTRLNTIHTLLTNL